MQSLLCFKPSGRAFISPGTPATLYLSVPMDINATSYQCLGSLAVCTRYWRGSMGTRERVPAGACCSPCIAPIGWHGYLLLVLDGRIVSLPTASDMNLHPQPGGWRPIAVGLCVHKFQPLNCLQLEPASASENGPSRNTFQQGSSFICRAKLAVQQRSLFSRLDWRHSATRLTQYFTQ